MHPFFRPPPMLLPVLALLACAAALGLAALGLPEAAGPLGLSAALAALGMAYGLRDASLKVTKALPNGAAAVTSDGIDLGHGAQGDFCADVEFLLTAPALVVGDLANGETITYALEHDDAASFSGAATLQASLLVQTGAGGAGAAAATKRFRLPHDVKRYVRIKATNSGGGDASDKSFTFEPCF